MARDKHGQKEGQDGRTKAHSRCFFLHLATSVSRQTTRNVSFQLTSQTHLLLPRKSLRLRSFRGHHVRESEWPIVKFGVRLDV